MLPWSTFVFSLFYPLSLAKDIVYISLYEMFVKIHTDYLQVEFSLFSMCMLGKNNTPPLIAMLYFLMKHVEKYTSKLYMGLSLFIMH